MRPLSRLARAMRLLYQDRVPPSAWRRVGIVMGAAGVFHFHRRRNRDRRRWEYRVVDTNDVPIDLKRDRDELRDDDTVSVPGYGTMVVRLDIDDEVVRHFEPV